MAFEAARAEALARGLYMTHDGTNVPLATIVDAHLINALLKALSEGDPESITEPLTLEVMRRGLVAPAMAVAVERTVATTNKFLRIFRTNNDRVQYAVRRMAGGYAVTRWNANEDRVETVRVFEFAQYPGADSTANAACEYAARAAKEEQ